MTTCRLHFHSRTSNLAPRILNPRIAPHFMDMINVEAAFVILSNATDPELASALQQNAALRRRIQNIISRGPPSHNTGNAPLHQHQASQRPAQQVPRGWPDGPMPAMSTAHTAPAAQFGSAGAATHRTPAPALGRTCQKRILTRKALAPHGHSKILGRSLRSTTTIPGTRTRRRPRKARASKAKLPRARAAKARASSSTQIGRSTARHSKATSNGLSPLHRRSRLLPSHCNPVH